MNAVSGTNWEGTGGESRTSSGKFVVMAKREEEDVWRFQVDGYSDLPGARSNQAAAINPKDLETLFDPTFAEQMEKLYIPGTVVSIVKDGKVIFTKGYGVADLEKEIPVTADKTIFRIGSITKVFTAAVMQLADRGKINLNQNTYMVYEKVVEGKR